MIDIERLKVDPEYWNEVAPEGATHYNTLSKQWFAVFDRVKAMRFDGEMWSPVKGCSVTLNFGGSEVIKRPQPSTASLLTDEQVEARMGEPHDPVNSPSHYASGGIECIDAMQAMLSRDEFIGYLRGNIFKYQWRYKLKNGVEDLKKAQWYQNKLIEVEGK